MTQAEELDSEDEVRVNLLLERDIHPELFAEIKGKNKRKRAKFIYSLLVIAHTVRSGTYVPNTDDVNVVAGTTKKSPAKAKVSKAVSEETNLGKVKPQEAGLSATGLNVDEFS
ncbi:MAG: hypothetical protein ACTS9Y_00735 [Methylophilus sp.]|uniref:hypothetical protein n=1 Tax=Methylophilus sp. TaxID=29541 RepID=UPI003FA193E2